MKPEQFYELVSQMRAAQRTYFKERTSSNLTIAKKLEKEVDQAIADHQKESPAVGAVQLSFVSIEEKQEGDKHGRSV